MGIQMIVSLVDDKSTQPINFLNSVSMEIMFWQHQSNIEFLTIIYCELTKETYILHIYKIIIICINLFMKAIIFMHYTR